MTTDVYFDFSASSNGDGTSPAQAAGNGFVGAYNTMVGLLPDINTTWWIRRTASVDAFSSGMIVDAPNFRLVGWPKSTDGLYPNRPAAGTTEGWDADADEYAIMTYSSTAVMIDVQSDGFTMSRIQFHKSGGIYAVQLASDTNNCVFENLYYDGSIGTSMDAAFQLHGNGHTMKNIVLDASMDSAGAYGIIALYGKFMTLTNIAFNVGEVNDVNDASVLYFYSESYQCRCFNISITTSGSYFSKGYAFDMDGSECSIHGLTLVTNDAMIVMRMRGTRDRVTGVSITGMCGGLQLTSATDCYIELPAMVVDLDKYTIPIYVTGSQNTVIVDGLTNNNVEGYGISLAGVGYTDNTNNVVVAKNVIANTTVDGGGSESGAIYSLNDGGVTGFWKGVQPQGVMSSSSVVRTGGGAYSIYCAMTAGDHPEGSFPVLGWAGQAEILWLDLAIGTHTVEFYGAHKLFTTPLGIGDFILTSEYLNTDGNIVPITNAGQGGAFEDDAVSVWSEAGLTGFKLSLEIVLTEAQVVPVRIVGNYPYYVNSYLYLDIEPNITSV